VTDIHDWLVRLGLEKYAAVFAEHEITLDVLPDLTESDIDRLALPTGPRRRLMKAVQMLGTEPRARRSSDLAGPRVEESHIPYGAERRQLTVMFCDLVGSTKLAERLDPELLRELMKTYRAVCGQVVARYDGHLAQYRGDGVMVYFGWPSAHEDDAERGVRAALEIVRAIKTVAADPPLAVRIGVATGTVVIGGPSAADDADSKLAVGDTPNLAVSLQAFARPDEIVIAPATRRLVGATFHLSDLGTHSFKGITQPVDVWRVDAVHRIEGRFEAIHGGMALTPLVGRHVELELLLHRWRQARDGEGQVVFVGGEPGIGKSRLIHTLLQRIAGEPRTVLRYQCSPYHVNSPMHPITQQVELAAGFTREDGPEQKLDKLETLVVGTLEQRAAAAPLVAALLSLPMDRYAPLKLSPQKQKEMTLEVLIAQVEALCQRQPVLILFEDVHWIDPTSQEAINLLAPRTRALRCLFLITYRTDEYTPPQVERARVTNLALDRLGRREGAELVAKVVAAGALPGEILEQIVDRTDGIPLFLEELTKSVLESGALLESGDQHTVWRPLPSGDIPTSLRDSLLARLDRLAPVKHIIQMGACIGRKFSYDVLARLSGLGNEELESALRTLVDAGLVYHYGVPPNATYTFKHALVQDAAYDSLFKSKRQQLHAELARVLETDFADRVTNAPDLLAHHFTQSGQLKRAIPLWRKAGELALRRMALREAVGHFEHGLGLLEQLSASTERDELELSIREPLNAAWTGLRGWAAPEVRANATQILEVAKRHGQANAVRTGLWAIWVNTTTQGRIADSLEWAERLLAEGDEGNDIDLQIFGHGAAMISQFYLGHLLEAKAHGDNILRLYDVKQASRWMQVTANDFRTLVGIWACQWTWMLGYPDRAVQLSDEKDAHARSLGHAFNLGFALTLGAYAFDYRGEPDRLLERVAEMSRLVRDQSLPFHDQVMLPQVEGLARLRKGQAVEAIALLQRGIETWNEGGGHSRVPYLKAALAEAIARAGDWDTGLKTIDECLEQIERPGWQERSHLAEVLRLKGWILARQGRAEEAEAVLRASLDWARQQQAKSWELRSATTLAQQLLQRDQRTAARELLGPVYNWFTEGFDTHDLRAARTVLDSLG
jgi:class 3 adenylate cyclase/tetratricopeptide (TPR) repeat protein